MTITLELIAAFTMVGPPSSSWRTPSAEAQAKYNLVKLPESIEPTPQEEEICSK